MRIIAGEFRGRYLVASPSDATRPITDRVKQSLFDIIAPRIEVAAVYDVFAGTGSMGLECLSRGAEAVTFFEIDRMALAGLRKNVTSLEVDARSRIVSTDVFRYQFDSNVDLVFLDPPYRFLRERPVELQGLAQRIGQGMSGDGILVFRHDAADQLKLPMECIDARNYGSMSIDFYRPMTQ